MMLDEIVTKKALSFDELSTTQVTKVSALYLSKLHSIRLTGSMSFLMLLHRSGTDKLVAKMALFSSAIKSVLNHLDT